MTAFSVTLDEFITVKGPILLEAYTNVYGRTSFRVRFDDPFSFAEFYDLDYALGLFFHFVEQFRVCV